MNVEGDADLLVSVGTLACGCASCNISKKTGTWNKQLKTSYEAVYSVSKELQGKQ